MSEDSEYEDYRNTLDEIVDGGGCMETMTAAADLRGEGPSKRDLLGSDALTAGVAESVDDVLAEVDTEEARGRLRADYDDLDAVRAALRETVDPRLFDALGEAGIAVEGVDALELDPAVCLKTFSESDLETALTLVPHVHEGGVVGRIVARQGRLTVHAIPEWEQSYVVVSEADQRESSEQASETLVLPDGRTADFTDATERQTGLDCDPERAARTEYVQRTVTVDGEEYVVETTCTTV